MVACSSRMVVRTARRRVAGPAHEVGQHVEGPWSAHCRSSITSATGTIEAELGHPVVHVAPSQLEAGRSVLGQSWRTRNGVRTPKEVAPCQERRRYGERTGRHAATRGSTCPRRRWHASCTSAVLPRRPLVPEPGRSGPIPLVALVEAGCRGSRDRRLRPTSAVSPGTESAPFAHCGTGNTRTGRWRRNLRGRTPDVRPGPGGSGPWDHSRKGAS